MIVVGLGNPGPRYESTRHNLGFRFIERLAERWGRPAFRHRFRADFAQLDHAGDGALRRIYLLKPSTFMNASGEAVQEACAFYKVAARDVLVAHDELDLPLGRTMLKSGGGSGGHNGLKSITERLGTPDYLRLRLGIGRPPPDFRGDVTEFLLDGAPTPSEEAAYESMLTKATEALELLLAQGLEAAMNRTNRRN